MKHDQWVKPFFKQYKRALALALFLGLLTFVFAAGLMFTSGYLISRAAEMPGNILMIHLPVIFVRIFGIGKPLLQYFERLTSHDWVLRMTSSLRLKLYTVLEKDAVFFRRSHRTGDILGLLAEDIGHIQNLYLRTVFPTIVAYALYTVLIIGLGFFSLWFALAMLLVLGVVVFLVPLTSALLTRARIERRKAMKNTLYAELTDNVLGVSDWIFAHRGHEYLSQYKTTQQAIREIDASLNRLARKRDLLIMTVFGIASLLVLVWAAGYFGGNPAAGAGALGVEGAERTNNWIAAFMLGFFPLIDAFTPLSVAATDSNLYRESVSRLNKLSDDAAPEKAATATMGAVADKWTHESKGEGGCEGVGEREPLTIKIEHVAFRYPGTSRMVLDDVDLTIAPGEKIAILGRSGSGKSTLASLIRGDLLPTQGSVTLSGHSTATLNDDIAHSVGVIQQQTYLFNTTLRENLRLGNPTASDDAIEQVLEQVGLREMTQRLPDGLATVVDEAGMRFSGGERHRIALARVLLQDVPIVMLDEPTVGLDPATEKALLATLFEVLHDKTLIMITHHLQGVAMMDRVIFIEDGTIELCGSPADLELSSARYRQLQAFDRGLALSAEAPIR